MKTPIPKHGPKLPNSVLEELYKPTPENRVEVVYRLLIQGEQFEMNGAQLTELRDMISNALG